MPTDPTVPFPARPSIFDDIEALRQATDLTATTREIMSHLPIGRPGKEEFFRTNPRPDMSLVAYVYEDKTERKQYFVAPNMRDTMGLYARQVLISVLFTWPSRVTRIYPVPLALDGRSNPWLETARDAVEKAKKKWVKMVPDQRAGFYRIFMPSGDLPEPEWSDKTFSELLETAFRGLVITSDDHPVVRQLQGLT